MPFLPGNAPNIEYVDPPNPGVGADFAFVFSKTVPVKVHSMLILLNTSAVAGNRMPTLSIVNAIGGNHYFEVGLTAAVAANAICPMVFSTAYTQVQAMTLGGLAGYGAPLPDLWIPPGGALSMFTTNLDVSDFWNDIHAMVES